MAKLQKKINLISEAAKLEEQNLTELNSAAQPLSEAEKYQNEVRLSVIDEQLKELENIHVPKEFL